MKDVEYYKQKLEEERELIVTELKEVGVVKNTKNGDDWEATAGNSDIQESDSNEVGDKLEDLEENAALVQELETRLIEVEDALGKITKGTYGLCDVDEAPIEEDRLEANPAARTCKQHLQG